MKSDDLVDLIGIVDAQRAECERQNLPRDVTHCLDMARWDLARAIGFAKQAEADSAKKQLCNEEAL